jgi:hypothetical protein
VTLRRPADETEADTHPLAGVLDRLMSRERGARSPVPSPAAASSAATDPERAPRRMLVVAGLGPTAGIDAVEALARWGIEGGRKVAVVDFDPGPRRSATGGPGGPHIGAQVPLASVPCGLDRLRLEDPGSLAAVVERLRRHEHAADLLLVRVPADDRKALAGAAFLAGALIVPLYGGDAALHAAFHLAREMAESFPGVSLVPFASDPEALDLFTEMARDFLGTAGESADGEGASLEGILGSLAAPPPEGFLPALLGAETDAEAPPRLLEMGTLEV